MLMCDNCTKAKVCKYKENCNILERDTSGSKIENIITLEIRCNQFEGVKLFRDTNLTKSMTDAQRLASVLCGGR